LLEQLPIDLTNACSFTLQAEMLGDPDTRGLTHRGSLCGAAQHPLQGLRKAIGIVRFHELAIDPGLHQILEGTRA
jgi:hypothetical protein